MRQRSYENETDGRLRDLLDHLDRLRSERRQCRDAAADHAGAIGMVYRAETNDYVRQVSGGTRPEAPERPPRPESGLRAPVPPRPPVREQVAKAARWVQNAFQWILAVPVGVFVGYGLGTLTGLPIQRQPFLLWTSLVIGVCAILGTKVFLGHLWHHVGRSKTRGDMNAASFWGAVALTSAVCLVEASLGAMALVVYSQRVAFEDSQKLAFAVALPMAIAISTCILLVSALKGYADGQEGLSEHEADLRVHSHHAEQHALAVSLTAQSHEEKLSDWRADVQRQEEEHANATRRYEQESASFENAKQGPEFQALLKYIGRISNLNVQIGEIEQNLTEYSVARGYGKASVV